MAGLWSVTLNRKYGNVIDRLEAALRGCPNELREASLWPVSREQGYVCTTCASGPMPNSTRG